MRTTENNGRPVFEKELLFLPQEKLAQLLEEKGTPLFLYDEAGLRAGAKALLSKFAPGDFSRLSFPVRSCPRKEVLRILAQAGASAYCCTERELRLALDSGFPGENIVYAMVIADEKIAAELKELDARIVVANEKILHGPLPRRVDIICEQLPVGNNVFVPLKNIRDHMGLTRAQVWKFAPELVEQGIDLGIVRLETASPTELKPLESRIKILLKYADDLFQDTGVRLSRICPGSCIGVLYHRNGPELDEEIFTEGFASIMKDRQESLCWNMDKRLVDPHGLLITTLLEAICKNRASLYVDTCSDVLNHPHGPRFHHVGLFGKPWQDGRKVCHICGPQPERKDYFTDKCLLPEFEIGDRVMLFDVGTALKDTADVPVFLYREDGTFRPVTAW